MSTITARTSQGRRLLAPKIASQIAWSLATAIVHSRMLHAAGRGEDARTLDEALGPLIDELGVLAGKLAGLVARDPRPSEFVVEPPPPPSLPMTSTLDDDGRDESKHDAGPAEPPTNGRRPLLLSEARRRLEQLTSTMRDEEERNHDVTFERNAHDQTGSGSVPS